MSDLSKPWVTYNEFTHCYETPDGTNVAAELCDNTTNYLDFIYITLIRAKQREAKEGFA